MKTSIALCPTKTSFAPLLYAGDIQLGIRRAAELGYDGVEIHLRDPQSEDLDGMIAAVQACRLQVSLIGTGAAYRVDGLSISAVDPAVRAQAVARLQTHIDFAARLGAQVVIGSMQGRLETDPATRRDQYQGAIEVVQQIADYAQAKRVIITLETLNRYEGNFLNTVADALTFLRDVDRPGVKILADTFHMNIEEVSLPAALAQAGDRLSHVHLVDSNRRAAGMGHIDFVPILHTLRDLGYDGYLSGEILPLPDDETAARVQLQVTRSLIRGR